MSSTDGNAQPYKMYNFNAMGDSEVTSFVGGDIMTRAYVCCMSVEGPVHYQPERYMGTHRPLTMGGGSQSGKGSY